MYLQLLRLRDNGESTIGTLSINGTFECFTLEDTHNEPKVYGKTRIPSGKYEIKLRNEGGMTQRYAKRFDLHKGMLWLQNVENFEWVYIHVGNDEEDTDGCILVGQSCSARKQQNISGSVFAYTDLYERVIDAIERSEDITIEVI
jgi:hypothetical protein